MSKTLDAKDRRLLALLAADARQPLTTLARKIALSRSATQERLQRLESSGVIQGYSVRLRWSDDEADAWLLASLRPGTRCVDVAPALLALPGVELCHALAGPVDLIVRVQAESIESISALRDAVAAIDGIAAVTTHLVLAHHR